MSFSGPASVNYPSPPPVPGSLVQPPRLSSNAAPPFYSVHRLGRKTKWHAITAIFLALVFHGAGAAQGLTSLHDVRTFARQVRAIIHAGQIQSVEVNIEVAPEPPPPAPPAEAQVEEPDAPPPPKRRPRRRRAPKKQAAPPPAAAQASRVLTAKADANEPLDLTGNTFIQGTANSYAGGVSASGGTSKNAVRNRKAKTGGVRGGQGNTPHADLSRRARPLRRQWNCPFPSEAELDQINYMQVDVTVMVGASGRASSAKVIKDPGYGFGRAAQRCAKRKRYAAAHNRIGKSVASTLVLTINFQR